MTVEEKPDAERDRTDWERLRALPEAEIERRAEEDPDNPATVSDAEWAGAVAGFSAIGLGVRDRPPKRAVRVRFDSDVVAFFARGGRGYQDRMNAVLRRHMERQLRKDAGR